MTVARRVSDVPGADEALVFLGGAYRMRLRRPGRTVEHPVAVAGLLADDAQPPRVVVAGILHDVLEDTDATGDELQALFGTDIAQLVGALTHDPSIRKYQARKAALRQQIVDAGPDAAAVSLADKAAKLRSVASRPARRKLRHYREALRGIEQRYGPSRLSAMLREELDRWPDD
jgi:(p)ppGpp synthase/HD superfamily hydrolase